MVALLTEQNVTQSLQQLRPGDIYVKPVLDGIDAGDFARFAETAERGRTAAGWAHDALAALAVDDARWRRWQQARLEADRRRPWVQAVEVSGLDKVAPEVVTRHIRQRPDTPLDTEQLQRDLLRVYGDGWYERVDYSLLTLRERNILRVMPVEKSWGPDYLRFAINLASTLSQGSTYGLRAAYQKTWLNRLGGEFLASVEFGSRTALELEWHQPLDPAQHWFGAVALTGESRFRDLYEGDQRIARYKVERALAELSLGASFGSLGQARAGWLQSAARAQIDTGLEVVPPDTVYLSGAVLALDLDQFDRLYFPTRGWAAQARYFRARDDSYGRLSVDLRGALPLGAWVLGARAAYTGSPHGQLPLFDSATLGGFLNLSAYGSDQFVADSVRYAHVRAERIIGRLPIGLRGDMRLGLALEAGRTGSPYTLAARSGVLDSVTFYLGGETPFGPVYVGLGLGSGGAANAYLFLGTP
jgi:NTE family protein